MAELNPILAAIQGVTNNVASQEDIPLMLQEALVPQGVSTVPNIAASNRATAIQRTQSEPPIPTKDLAASIITAGEEARVASNVATRERVTQEGVISSAVKAAQEATNSIGLGAAKAALETQNAKIEMHKAAGGNEQLYKLARHQKATHDFAMKQQQEVMDLESISIAEDGFLPWLSAQMQVTFKEGKEARDAVVASKSATNLLVNTEQASTSAGKAILNAEQTMTEQTLQDMDKQQQAQLQIKLAERQVKLAETNAAAVTEDFNRTIESSKAINNMRATQYQMLAAGTQARMLDIAEATDQRIADTTNAYYADLGLNTRMDVTDVRARREVGGTDWEKLQTDFGEGQALEQAAADPRVGNSFSEGANQIIQGTSGRALINSPKMSKHIASMQVQVQRQMEATGVDPTTLTEAEIHRAINETNKTVVEAERKEQTPEGSSLFSAPPWSVMLNTPAVKSTKLYQEVLSPLAEILSKKNALSEQQVFDLAASAVADKTLTPEEAAGDIAALFTQAANLNTSTEQYMSYHIDPQTSYNVRLYDTLSTRVLTDTEQLAAATPAILAGGSSKVYNAMDEVSVLNFLVRRIPKKTKWLESLTGE